jgi:hypothetical protein
MSNARQPPSSAAFEERDPRERLAWYVRSSPTKPSASSPGSFDAARRGEDVARPAVARDDDAAAQPGPSRPIVWRRISAPVSFVTDSRSASARRPARDRPVELDPTPRDCTSGRACFASRATSSAVSSTSSNSTTTPRLLSWCAPTTTPTLGEERSDGAGVRRDSFGTRTSNPAARASGR